MRRTTRALGIVAILAVGTIAAQTPAPTLKITSPTEDTYVSGPTRLTVVVDPVAAERNVVQVIMFADGRQVCTREKPPFECDWDAGSGVREHQIRAAATMKDGTRLVTTIRTRSLEVSETVDVDVVQVTAVVTDGDGKFVRGLKQEDFTITDDNRPQQITHFAAENIPLELVTALDVSSSMEDALPRVKEAAKRFVSAIEERDQVTVLAFNENIFTLARRATDPAARLKAIDRMAPWGGTALYDAIIKAVDILGRQPGRRAVVVFSDGEDQSSHATLEAAIRATEGSDATMYAIGQGRATKVTALQTLLRQIATVSGGRAFFTEDAATLDGIFADIIADLRNQYLLSYPVPDGRRDDEWHTIKVEAAGGRYQVRARQGYRLAKRQDQP